MNRSLLLLLALFFFSKNLSGQDIHHTQFYTTPLNINPGLTGVFNGDHRIAVNLRRQWWVDNIVRYMTITGSYDMKFYPKKWKSKGNWNGGILFNYDQAGDSRLGLAHLGFSVSYSYPLNVNNIITLGGLFGVSHRRFNPDELRWDSQWTPGEGFEPSRASGEDFDKTSTNFIDLSGGLNYRWQKSKRTKVDIGVAAFHLNQPDQKFFDQSLSIKLPIRFNISATPSIKLTNSLDLLLHALYQNQDPFEEFVFGGYARIYINQQRGKELNLLLGFSDRIDDGLVPKIAVEWKDWYFGFSYDVTSSGFKQYTDQKGGPEFSLMKIITKSRPLRLLKSCPIF